MAKQIKFESVAAYIAGFPAETRVVLEALRELIRECAPEARETISYDMPTFDLNGRHLVHFAGWQHHIGMYPFSNAIVTSLGAELAAYKQGKGSVQIPLAKPLPVELIRRFIAARIVEVGRG